MDILSPETKLTIRHSITTEARQLKGIPYVYGAEWTDYSKPPEGLDCSELVEGVFKIVGLQMPDGAQAQFNYTLATGNPAPGDLAFFGKGAKIDEVYHVGIVLNLAAIIEARGFQPESHFETGKVIIRPASAWTAYRNFIGFRSHPKLA